MHTEKSVRLADFIIDQMEQILQAWERFASTLDPLALQMDRVALRNHAKVMLQVLASVILKPPSLSQQAEESQGGRRRGDALSAAESHADVRLSYGFTIVQLVSEYRALRSSVLDLWFRDKNQVISNLQDLTRFNDAIDQALVVSIARYDKVASENIRQEQRKLEALLQAAPVGITMADSNGKLTVFNHANVALWGHIPMSNNVEAYAVHKGWWADGSPRHGQPIKPDEWGLARALQGEDSPRQMIEIEPFDAIGTRKTILLYAAPVRDAKANITGAVVAQMDITDRVKVEAALRESEAKFRTIADALPQMVWSTRADGHHDYFNERWYAFTGMPLGSTDGERWNGLFHPEDQEQAWDKWRHSLATGEPYEIQYRLRHHTGEYRWTLGRALPLLDEMGTIVRWMGTCTDIHHQKQIEQELTNVHAASERLRRLYETFLDNSPDLAYVFDVNHRFTYANKLLLTMWGKTWDESIGKTCLELGYEPWHAEMHGREIEQIKATRQPIKGEVAFTGTFGPRIYEYIFVPVVGPNEEVEAIAGTTRDVTDRKKNEEALRDANRRKDEFLAMLAHELRNPLAPINSAAYALGMHQLDPKAITKVSGIITRQVAHMTGLIDDLLDISRVSRGLIRLKLSANDLKAIVNKAIEQVRPLIETHNHRLTLDLGAEPAFIRSDEKRLVQIVANLLNNAAKYTPNGGVIQISMKTTGSEIELSIQDDGLGISPEIQPFIFDLFTQAQRNTDHSAGGLGIGLALVKNLVDLHGGKVACHSQGLGHGSTFTVVFPRLHQAENKPDQQGNAKFEKAEGVKRRVLIVDDNVDAANMLALYLQFNGHEVFIEHTAERALHRASVSSSDVFILDIGLPDMNGNELARRLKANKETCGAVLIAVTGYGQEHDRAATKAAGFNHHLVKPIDTNKLLELLE
jgi:PAS domain S-box-containing protein